MRRTLIFSDLDGTFLDDDYRPVLSVDSARVAFARHRVVWVSSRTAEELLEVQRRISHAGDAIGENGGVFVTREHEFAAAMGSAMPLGDVWVVQLAAAREETDARVRAAFAAAAAPITTVDALGPAELARRSGYSLADANRALRRRTSVLLVDPDAADPRVQAALNALRNEGMAIAHGGRWTSIVRGVDKGSAVRAYVAVWSSRNGGAPEVVAGIGDAENDEALLRAVGLPFVVRRAHRGHAPALTRIPGARLLEREGTAGWLEMLEYLHAIAGERR